MRYDLTSCNCGITVFIRRRCRSSHHAPANNFKAMSWGWSNNNRLNAENNMGESRGWEEDVCELLMISWENLNCTITPYRNCYIRTVGQFWQSLTYIHIYVHYLALCIPEFNVWVDFQKSCSCLHTMLVVGGCQAIAVQSEWFQAYCYHVMQLLGWSRWLLGCC